MSKQKILILATGGTIVGHTLNSCQNENSSVLILDSVLKKQICSSILFHVDFVIKEVSSIDSSHMKLEIWQKLCHELKVNYSSFDAFIIIHGTNTLAYTAAALSFALSRLKKPVVITGSQVPLGAPGSDGLINLENAFRASLMKESIRGVVCVFGSFLIAGTRVKKVTEFDYDSFHSYNTLELGRIGRTIKMNDNLLREFNLNFTNVFDGCYLCNDNELVVKEKFNLNLLSLTAFPGMSSQLLESIAISNSVKGVILRAYGAGDVSADLISGLRFLKEKEIPVVVTSQAPNGLSNFKVNDAGGILEKEALAIPSWDMNIESQTVKLAWLLAQKLNYDEICHLMVTNMRGEINTELKDLN